MRYTTSFRAVRLLLATTAASSFCGGAALAEVDAKILATIKPVHALVAQVMGATGEPQLLVGGSASPHAYVLKPSDAKKLAVADLVFRMSAEVEPFTIKAAKTLPKTTALVTLQQAPGVVTLPQREGGAFEDHRDEPGHGHAHGDHKSGDVDGHVWLDPANAKAMLDQIAATLAARTPTLAATYRANALAAKAGIDTLAADLERELAPLAGKPYVVFHDAYQYFERRFGLTVVGSITVNPEIPPSGKRLSTLRAKITKLGATCVFGEPNFDGKVIATITEGTAARTGTLDPEGAALQPGPALYDTLMRNLAANVKACLAPAS
jgi:zinc transport system substrate-binding protein